ncbi:MAG: alpha/beta hydrolase [Desulfobacula sp.]|jgi:lysophospholipase|uniref:alpha/beta fold hydrolase n=1 Tax=Desulfobacula sp. TaxID=2593537 RepID=UPI001DCF54C2|nr:alpha/beta hydrolase [Desulfobacula sp.]MBT3484157.1 alpha/beta hydrolase [Desulfobacula sp.]MBT3803730.1 alpha/beta hydrolase [Desulfobacula sp.]MBT4024435.1 alpha/beta hydrolase [Desulfobacula sp.]MBT4198476.1 alpha/beta hydrolase [Desulfobacula sp.]
MTDNNHLSNQDIFAYHYFTIKKNLTLRYGIAQSSQKHVKGFVFLLHGRAEFIEKYKGIAKRLQKKGLTVVSPDWRGQGLSSRELENRHKGHINRFDDYVDDLEELFSKLINSQKLPVYILAHSMGGHIALRFMERQPLKIKKAVLVSPMIDITLPAIIKPVLKILSKKLSKTSFAKKYTFGSKDYSFKKAGFKGNNLCHDPKAYWILHDEIAKNPELAIGGITWGWLNAAFESIKILKQDTLIDKITTPILMINAGKDSIVSTKAQEKLSQKLPHCTFVSIKGAFHELLFEEPQIKHRLWDAIHRFIDDGS